MPKHSAANADIRMIRPICVPLMYGAVADFGAPVQVRRPWASRTRRKIRPSSDVASGWRCGLRDAQNDDRHSLRLAPQLELPPFAGLDLGRPGRLVRHEQLAGPRGRREPRRDVDDIAERRDAGARALADGADERDPCVDADADRHPRAAGVP